MKTAPLISYKKVNSFLSTKAIRLFVIFCTLFFSSAKAIPLSHEPQKPVFTIKRTLGNINLESATGFFIDQNTFVTTFHAVVKLKFPFNIDVKKAIQRSKGPKLGHIQITGVKQLSALHDLALLKTSEPVPEEFILKPGKLIGKNIYITGYPVDQLMRAHLHHFSGMVIQKTAFRNLVNINSSRDSFQGLSGSPIFNEKGEVVGIVFREFSSSGLLLGIPIKYALQLQKSPDLPNIPVKDLIEHEIQQLRALARLGDSLAQIELGQMLLRGKVVKKNEDESLRWLERATTQNPKEALTFLVSWYIEKAYKSNKREKRLLQRELKTLLLTAAEYGNVIAQYYLAMFIGQGAYGFQQSYEESLKWLFKAASQGHLKSYEILEQNAKREEAISHENHTARRYLRRLNNRQGGLCPNTISELNLR